MSKYLPPDKTEASEEQVAQALYAAWVARFEAIPSATTIYILLAQWALETGRGKHMVAYNIGNAKAGPEWHGCYTFFKTTEVLARDYALMNMATAPLRPESEGGDRRTLVIREPERPLPLDAVYVDVYPPHPWCRFRAFETLDDGISDYLHLLHTKYEKAWGYVIEGKPAEFCLALKRLRYFTADVSVYMRVIISLVAEYSARPVDYLPPLDKGQVVASSADTLARSIDDAIRDGYKRKDEEP
jgi:hypothetical protein